MAIDHLPAPATLSANLIAIQKGDTDELVRTLIQIMDLLKMITRTANLLIDTNNVQWRYFAAPDPESGDYANGTMRFGQTESGEMQLQERVSGTWTKRMRLTA